MSLYIIYGHNIIINTEQTSEEGLWVEEPWQPNNSRKNKILGPAVQLLTTQKHIIKPKEKQHICIQYYKNTTCMPSVYLHGILQKSKFIMQYLKLFLSMYRYFNTHCDTK